ncbi:hypothetical protein [Planctomycetes bacterium K23_9]|uniref:Tetratricopeptide repeat protein n=1 Tax=Stieleria marina TaxID=1930275 RepID=A0A517P351_9BACT|nr:hypothetical protein K239x_58210 [Planctomycetes bacterium K23_9]
MPANESLLPRHYLTCLWPGMTELWWRGRLSGLAAAIVFAAALNLLLVMRFMYPEWLSAILVRMACWIGVAAWAFYVIRSFRELPEILTPRVVSEEPDRFEDAQHAYLMCEWEIAEKCLMQVLAIEPRDPPALLLLSGVYRHTDRAESAKLVVTELSRLEIGDTWALEIDAEAARIERDIGAEEEAVEEDNESDSDEDKIADDAADLTAA